MNKISESDSGSPKFNAHNYKVHNENEDINIIIKKIKTIIITQFNPSENINFGLRFYEDLKADGCDMVDFIMELENAFEVEINDEISLKIKNFEDVIECIFKLQNLKSNNI